MFYSWINVYFNAVHNVILFRCILKDGSDDVIEGFFLIHHKFSTRMNVVSVMVVLSVEI